ncbi:hypothetical protein NC653_012384 [Populus alba x Populus x berolinensis]|uniref:Uncharacterized protein n=1 Tax=Populus alba x Populus x berolinensis TaxID=444605 RepID=A0AAD6R4Z7_9ROSI|nr:hypothetical protein NC653_012384 [Populus alba x Populus x berolinensis]
MIVHDQIPRAGGREEKTEHPTWKLSSLVRLWRWRVPDSAMPPEDYIRWTSLVEVEGSCWGGCDKVALSFWFVWECRNGIVMKEEEEKKELRWEQPTKKSTPVGFLGPSSRNWMGPSPSSVPKNRSLAAAS